MSLRFAKDELRYYVFTGRTATKKVKTLVFHQGVAGPVWDRKIHALMTRLPYFRAATEAEIATVESAGKQTGAPAKAKAKPAPAPVVEAKQDERDNIKAELDRLSIGYDKRWGVEKLREQLALAKRPVASAEPVDREFNEVFS